MKTTHQTEKTNRHTSKLSNTKKKKFYVVFVGRKLGIFFSWAEVKIQVDCFKGARHKSFKTWEAARRAFINDDLKQ